jgi:hypothetical protein
MSKNFLSSFVKNFSQKISRSAPAIQYSVDDLSVRKRAEYPISRHFSTGEISLGNQKITKHSLFQPRARNFAEIAKSQVADDISIGNVSEYNIDFGKNLAIDTFGQDEVRIASHNVFMATKKENGQKYVLKNMSAAYVGLEQHEANYSPEEARRQAVLEVLAMKIGDALCPTQFSKSKIVTQGAGDKKTYWVASPFVPNAPSIREIKKNNEQEHGEDSEHAFFLEEGITTIHANVAERFRLPASYVNLMKKPGYAVANPVVDGRINLLMALYVLGEGDDLHNRDGNILLQGKRFFVDEEKKVLNAIVTPIAIDCGLCFSVSTNREGIIDKSFKLATRDKGSVRMGLSIGDEVPNNVRECKNKFLSSVIKVYEAGAIEDHIKWAEPYLTEENMKMIDGVRVRLDTCYLAAKCVKAGLDSPEKEVQAKELMEGELRKIDEKRNHDRSLSDRIAKIADGGRY